GGEARPERPFRAGAPADRPPFDLGQRALGGEGQDGGRGVLARTAPREPWKDERDANRISLLLPRNADSPCEPAGTQALSKRRREAIAGIREQRSEAHAGCDQPIKLREGHRRLRARGAPSLGHAGTLEAAWIA